MNGIFYFSSTGNSLYIAEQIKNELGGEIRYIPKFAGDVNTYDKIIIVSPIHRDIQKLLIKRQQIDC